MRRAIAILVFASILSALFVAVGAAMAFEEFDVWPGVAPGEKGNKPRRATYEYWKPENKTSDALVIVCPGGAYLNLAYDHEGRKIAEYFNSKGITAVVLKYRTPFRIGRPIYEAAWQDAQRTVRIVRSRAEEWGINPDKIGIIGFSAGGHLALLVATSSQTRAYEPIDAIDELPSDAALAVPVYPGYVLKTNLFGEPKYDENGDLLLAKELAFDDKTPPMCLVVGDEDFCNPLTSIGVYTKLRKKGIPAELHIYCKVAHGFGGNPTGEHVGDWLNRVYAWMETMGF